MPVQIRYVHVDTGAHIYIPQTRACRTGELCDNFGRRGSCQVQTAARWVLTGFSLLLLDYSSVVVPTMLQLLLQFLLRAPVPCRQGTLRLYLADHQPHY